MFKKNLIREKLIQVIAGAWDIFEEAKDEFRYWFVKTPKPYHCKKNKNHSILISNYDKSNLMEISCLDCGEVSSEDIKDV